VSDRKPYSLRLPEDLDRDFRAFAKAHHGASKNQIIIDAIRFLIRSELAKDSGLRERFEKALRESAEEKETVLRVVRRAGDEDGIL